MHRAILCIGSNIEDACRRIEEALDRLSQNRSKVVVKSDVYTVSLPYFNCVAVISTELDKIALIALTKEIEIEMGRTKSMKLKGEVPIDIDVVVFDNITLRSADYSADYFIHGFSSLNE